MQISGARNAIYVGDDVTDEDVFRIARPDLLSIRVEHAEASAAGFFLPHFDDIVRLLEQLHRRLEAAVRATG